MGKNAAGRGGNAEIAAKAFNELVESKFLDKHTAWRAIAQLLLTCDIWGHKQWVPFKNVIVYRESNDFKEGNAVLGRAKLLSDYVARELGLAPEDLPHGIALYWKMPGIREMQPHNLVGHAFRSILVEALKKYGDPEISYAEEVSPHDEFQGHQFQTRSKNAKIDIVARRGQVTVALISSRWRFRHDRVDLIDEALAYITPARRVNPNCRFYAWLGEFAPNRLSKVLEHCPPSPNPALNAAVHFNPLLITDALKENGRTVHLKGLDWLIDQSFSWR